MTVDARRLAHPLPEGAYISDEGWIIVGDEAWTIEEWNSALNPRLQSRPYRRLSPEERATYKRDRQREYRQRRRARGLDR